MESSAIVRVLKSIPAANIITRTHTEVVLTSQAEVESFFQQEKPDQVYMAAAKAGGIDANKTYPAEFIYDNLMVDQRYPPSMACWSTKGTFPRRKLYLSETRTPANARRCFAHRSAGASNESYAIAKIAGIKLCESYNRQYCKSHGVDYRSVMPTNLYGPGDNYHPENSHLIPALIQRFYQAKVSNTPSVVIWGSGTPRREFLYVDYMAAASVHIMNPLKPVYNANIQAMKSLIKVGFGSDLTIAQVANAVAKVVGFDGAIKFDLSKPDGTPRKWIDSSRLNSLGWHARVGLIDGLKMCCQDFLRQREEALDK